ncbi:glycosyltransferase [Lysobacter sp. TAF61]|uniref:glycosyltransferase n=1 Tax=Lysobacter sp. TAF61 TaxID=3233072 RepID=UPI003F9E71DD
MKFAQQRGISKDLLALRMLTWVREHAWLRAAYRIIPKSLRSQVRQSLTDVSGSNASFKRTPAWDKVPPVRSHDEIHASAGEHGNAGVNIYAYFRGQFGLAEGARLYTQALLDEGYPVALHDIELDIPHGFDDRTMEGRFAPDAPHEIHLLFVNPDYLDEAMDKVGRGKFDHGYVMACWFWELERIPEAWLPALERVDEVIVASTFIEKGFEQITAKPIFKLPIPVGEAEDSGLSRADFGLRPGAFVFLSTFDFNSSVERKNPFAALEAFRAAFPPERRDVQLLVKSSNGHRYPEMLLRLLSAAAADPRIVIRDEIIERRHLHALQRCVDAYVSLHRAEGFGLGMAESMRLGKPVVATGWSGNTEFMSDQDSCLVGYRLLPLAQDQYPFWEGQRWAEPDIAQAAGYMRRLVDEPEYAAAVGARAAARVRQTLSPHAVATRLASRLDQIRLGRDGSHPPGGARDVKAGRLAPDR